MKSEALRHKVQESLRRAIGLQELEPARISRQSAHAEKVVSPTHPIGGVRTRDLPACSAMPQATVPPRTPCGDVSGGQIMTQQTVIVKATWPEYSASPGLYSGL